MLQRFENKEFIEKYFKYPDIYERFSINNRVFWTDIERGMGGRLSEFDGSFDSFPPLEASSFMRFERSGDRSIYETEYFKRRRGLLYYTLKEAFENSGRYIDRIIDIVWMILEETTWAVPAHAALAKGSDCLPSYNDNAVDLFAAETGAMLAFVLGVMRHKFDGISRNISPRIERQLHERIIVPYLEHEHDWWMGLDGNRVNNWNPWINSNILLLLPVVKNRDTAGRLVLKIMKTLDCYADSLPDDGACDEGPSYWFMSGISLLECLYRLHEYSAAAVNVFNEEKVKNIFHYFIKVCISDEYVTNFADAPAKFTFDYGVAYKIAKLMNDEVMKEFCKKIYDGNRKRISLDLTKPIRIIDYAAANNELSTAPAAKSGFCRTSYFESVQLMTRRLGSGIFLAAKGGHNDESHNHNDVGNFIIYKNGNPFIIDAGNMVYTKDTFGEKRYTIWTNVSQYHNLPAIGGSNQHEGKDFRARNVSHGADSFSLDIGAAYENRADIGKWVRSFDWINGDVTVSEKYCFKRRMSVTLNFMCAVKPVRDNNTFRFRKNGTELCMAVNTDLFDIMTEEIPITDERLIRSWNNKLYRLRLTLKNENIGGEIIYSFK